MSEVLTLESKADIWNTSSVNYVIFRGEKLIWKDIPEGQQHIRSCECYTSLGAQLPVAELEAE